MILKVTRTSALARRRHFLMPSGEGGFVSSYIGSNRYELAQQAQPADVQMGPMATLLEQDPMSTVQAHFHGVDQFQVFVGGSGRIGTHRLGPVMVHFAAPHSPYGPIVAGPEGLSYLTLRPSWDPGAQWMPESMAKLRSIPDRKHRVFASDALDLCPDTTALTGTSCIDVMPCAVRGGVGAWLRRAGPGRGLEADATGSHGQFWYVLAGGLEAEDGALSEGACIFIGEREPVTEFRAGARGVEVLQVQFPALELPSAG